jgi:TrbL/VirB6 plasmid conjugal transfer protein
MSPINIFTAFYDQGGNLAALITPYALRLLYLLLFVEVGTIAITWMRGNDDIPDLLWRLVYLLFSSAFAFWWISDSWTLGKIVLGSFHMIGQNISGAPDLTPSQFLDIAGQIFQILWNAPSSSRMIPSLALAIAECGLALIIFGFLALVAVAAMFTVASALLLIGPGSLFVAFMTCRFTTSLSENYFNWLIRTGAAILGFFIVLSTCQHSALEWTTKLAQQCGAVLTTLPSPVLGSPPRIVNATVCTAPIPTESLSTLFVDALLVVVMGLGIPTLMAAFAGSGIHLALEHLAAARYLGGSAMRSIAGGLRSLSHQIERMRSNNQQQTTLQQRMTAGAEAAARVSPSQQLTTKLPPQSGINSFGVKRTQGLSESNGAKPTSRI